MGNLAGQHSRVADGDPKPPDSLQRLADGLAAGGEDEALLAFTQNAGERWSYRDLDRAVDQCATWLVSEKGVAAGDAVILCGPSRSDWIVAALALMRSGACLVPVDAQFSPDTFRHVLHDSGARLALLAPATADRFGDSCEEAGVDVGRLEPGSGFHAENPARGHDGQTRQQDGGEEKQGREGRQSVAPDDRAILFYTSGTTGPPKGVPLTHRNVTHQIRVLAEAGLVGPGDRVLLPLPLHHVYPLVIGLLVPLALRVTVILPSAFTGNRIAMALRDGRATFLIGVPRLYEALVKAIEDRLARRGRLVLWSYRGIIGLLAAVRRHFGWYGGKVVLGFLHRNLAPSLRVVVSGGAALDPRTAWTLEALGWRVGSGYGLTETSPMLTMTMPGGDRFDTAGKRIRDTELKIDRETDTDAEVDSDAGADEAAKESGEILARGPGVFGGYHNMPDETEKAFTPDGWFRTGDLGHMDADGFLHLAGRKSTMIVTRSGENVQPDTVEAAYARHESIDEIAVFERDGKLVGLVVPAPSLRGAGGADGGPDQVEQKVDRAVREVSSRLPSYQRLGDYRLTGESIPRTRLGKPRRHLIEERFERAGEEAPAEGPSAGGVMDIDELSDEDRALLEDEPARAVYDMLGERFPDRRITPDDDLQMDLGIDSIAWLDLSLEISARSGVTLSEEAIAEISTVRDLLDQVAGGGGEAGAEQGASVEEVVQDPGAKLDESQRRWLEPPAPMARRLASCLDTLNRMAIRGLFHPKVEGRPGLADGGAAVLAPNHASYLDPFVLAAALGREQGVGSGRLVWAGWTGIMFAGPFRRAVARLLRVLPIDPAAGPLSSLAFGAAALKRGEWLVWFPEGRRSPDGRLQPFRPGLGRILEHRPVRVHFLESADPNVLAEEGEGEDRAERIVDGLRKRIAAAMEGGDR